jgi:hypothetical protein
LLHNKEKLMKTRLNISRTLAVLALAASAAAPALAGRPLAVDDAGTNATGEGHVEAWVARSDGATAVNVSPSPMASRCRPPCRATRPTRSTAAASA